MSTKSLFVASILILLGMASPPPLVKEGDKADVEVFMRKGCPHCESAKRFLEALQQDFPDLTIHFRDVGEDPDARARLMELASQFKVSQIGVPAFWVKGHFIVGFSSHGSTGQQLKEILGRPPPKESQKRTEGVCELDGVDPCLSQKERSYPQVVRFPLLGPRTLSDLGLPVFTILLGLLDGFNPCAMWVLLFLLSLLATLRDRTKMAWLGGTFVIMSGVVYFMLMTAWLHVFFLIGYARVTQVVLGGLAGIVGVINVKDFFAFGKGVTLAIPESAKPGFYERIRSILQEQHFSAALAGIIVLAFVVNLFELACTAGFPALYTQILSQHSLDWWAYYGYIGLYNVAYIADDAIMVFIGVITLSHRKLQEQEGRWLKMIGGVVMLGLASFLIAAPDLLF